MRFFFVLLPLLSFCSYVPLQKHEPKKNTKFWILAGLFPIKQAGDFYSQMFRLNPIFLNGKNYNFFERVSKENVSQDKKKLILIHGWQPKDRDSNPIPSEQDLKVRLVEDIWKEVFESSFFINLFSKDYEVYFYTYLTSSSVPSNGSRLRDILDTYFLNCSNNYILAHSMGGLVVRDALYQRDTPLQIQEIFVLGTPFHGSPWASLEFQENKTPLGDYAAFLTESEGGKNLAWDNFDSSINGARNSYLESMNSKNGKDFLITAFYGELDKNASGYSGNYNWLNLACNELGTKFSPSDCIVPVQSAKGEGLNFKNRYSLGSLNHLDINLKVLGVQSFIINQLP